MKTHDAIHDNLPVMNGLKWTEHPRYAGIYFCDEAGQRISLRDFAYEEKDGMAIAKIVHDNGWIEIVLQEQGITINADREFLLEYAYACLLDDERVSVLDEKTVAFEKRGFAYQIKLTKGRISGLKVYSENGELRIVF